MSDEPAVVLPMGVSVCLKLEGGASFEAMGLPEAVDKAFARFMVLVSGKVPAGLDLKVCLDCGVSIPTGTISERCEECTRTRAKRMHRVAGREHMQEKRAGGERASDVPAVAELPETPPSAPEIHGPEPIRFRIGRIAEETWQQVRFLWERGESIADMERLCRVKGDRIAAYALAKRWPARKGTAASPVAREPEPKKKLDFNWTHGRLLWDQGSDAAEIAGVLGCTLEQVRERIAKDNWPRPTPKTLASSPPMSKPFDKPAQDAKVPEMRVCIDCGVTTAKWKPCVMCKAPAPGRVA